MMAPLGESIAFQNIAEGSVLAEPREHQDFRALADAVWRTALKPSSTLTAADITIKGIGFTAVVAEDLPNGSTAGQTRHLSGRALAPLQQEKIIRTICQS